MKTNLKLFIINIFTRKSCSQLTNLSYSWNYSFNIKNGIKKLQENAKFYKSFKLKIRRLCVMV